MPSAHGLCAEGPLQSECSLCEACPLFGFSEAVTFCGHRTGGRTQQPSELPLMTPACRSLGCDLILGDSLEILISLRYLLRRLFNARCDTFSIKTQSIF